MSVLIKPLITEKATSGSELLNRYTFVVKKEANKLEIKKAIEDAYGVDVQKVRVLNYPVHRKNKFTKKGMVKAVKSAYKKAVIQVPEGESIDFYNNI